MSVMSTTIMSSFFDDEREALLAVPASALDGILGRPSPTIFVVRRRDGREAHHGLVTAIDRLRRETVEHPASASTFAEDVERLRSLLAPVLAPWPALRTESPEATDREVRDEWARLLAPWPAVELISAPVRRAEGELPLLPRGRAGLIPVPGRGGTAWRLEDMLSPEGLRRIRGLARLEGGAMHVFWRPAPGAGGAILVDDATDKEHPILPSWTLWAQPHALVQTSQWKTQLVFRLPGVLDERGDALVAALNARYGDPAIHDAGHWMRLPGTWNHKRPGASWCARILAMGRSPAMERAWLERQAERLPQLRPSAPTSAPRRPAPAEAQDEGVSSRSLPEPEDIKEGRNVEATRAVGRYLARHWGDVAGATEFLQNWNSRLLKPLDGAELDTVLRSILREDVANHPERWQNSASPTPVRRTPARSPVPQGMTSYSPVAARPAPTKSQPKTAGISEAELDALVHWHVADMRGRGAYPDMPDEDLDMVLRSSIRRSPDPWRVVARRGTAETPPLVCDTGSKASDNDSEDEQDGPRP